MSSQFSLCWNNYSNHITNAFGSLRSHEDLVDVTLCCEGRKIRAHKILLSACSAYFKDVFKENPCQHPVIIFKNVKYEDLLAVIEFIYQGEVNIKEDSLSSFLHTAEMLNVQGLTDTTNPDALIVKDNNIITPIGPTIKRFKIQPEIKSVSMTAQTYPIVNQNQTNELMLTQRVANFIVNRRTFSEKTDNTDFVCNKKRRISQEPEPDVDDQQHVDENIYEEFGDGELQQSADNVMNDESHFLKAEPKTLKSTISMTYQSNEEEKTLVKYKQIEDDHEIKLIYQDSESEQRDTSEMEQLYTIQESTESEQHTAGLGTAQATPYQAERTLDCGLCQRIFTSVSALKRHMESKHNETTVVYTCQPCEKSFKTKWSLSTHTSRFHRNKQMVLNNAKLKYTISELHQG